MPAAYPPNSKLRAARQRRNWTLDDVARKLRALMLSRGETQVGVAFQHVYRWEHGIRRPGMRHRHYLCLLFELEPEQLGFLPSGYVEPDLVTRPGQPSPWAGNGHIAQSAVRRDELKALNLTRRKLLAASGLLSAAIGAETAAEATERLVEPLDRAASIASGRAAADDALISDLNTIAEGFGRASERVPGELLVEPLRAHVALVKHLLKQPLLPTQRDALLRNASQVTSLLSTLLFFDQGDRVEGRRLLVESIGMGEESSDAGMHVLGLVRAARQFLYCQETDKSTRLLAEALRLAERTCSRNTQSWILVNLATAYATLRQPKEVPRLLERAAKAQERSRPENEPYWIRYWNHANVAGYIGTAYIRIDQPGPARAALQDALSTLEPSWVMRRRLFLIDLATTYVQDLEVEAACDLATSALEISGPMRQATTVLHMADLRRRLSQWPKVRAVRELDERLRSVVAV